jgi:hypothetical protein
MAGEDGAAALQAATFNLKKISWRFYNMVVTLM